MSHLYIPPCLHLDFVNNSGTIRNGFFQKTADSGYYSNRGRQIEDIMYIIDKLELTQLYFRYICTLYKKRISALF